LEKQILVLELPANRFLKKFDFFFSTKQHTDFQLLISLTTFRLKKQSASIDFFS